MADHPTQPPCLLKAWSENESGLKYWLYFQLRNHELADDILHDVFIQALGKGGDFCTIVYPKAWFFQVAKNCLVDHFRKQKRMVDLKVEEHKKLVEETEQVEEESAVVDQLTQCLPRVLSELDSEDSDILQQCDVNGVTIVEYAKKQGIGLAAAKSRIQRARKKLRKQLVEKCQVQLDEANQVCCFTPRV